MNATTGEAQPWQPHDHHGGGGDPHRSRLIIDPGQGGAGLPLEVTAGSEVAAVITPIEPGVVEIELRPTGASAVRAAWELAATDVVAYWTPGRGGHGLPPFWAAPATTALERGAPVGSLIGSGDLARCTFAVGDAIRPCRIRAGVVEETGEFGIWVEQQCDFDHPLVLRLDLAGLRFADSLAGVAHWWSARYPAESAPEAARRPVYSTWYTMQQHVTAESVESQAGPAADLGCTMIIVDDGWHSTDRGRGYGHVGEWDPSPEAFADLRGHVRAVHDRGLDYLLWYSLPFVGRRTALWPRVEPYLLTVQESMDAGVVDPRYPFIRTLLVDRISRAVTEWGMDGLKIDFIDQFAVDDPPAAGPESDCASVTEGVRRLFDELHDRLRSTGAERPLIELRQPYVSPGLWRHAAMIRAGDCPLSAADNRQRIVDLRLIAGPLAVHADMMMWHRTERPEQVAVQLINSLFAVPQISVDLTEQSAEQLAVLKFWLGFVTDHATVLQHGRFRPVRPELSYPLVIASGADCDIVGRYAPLPIEVPADRRMIIANADATTDVLLESAVDRKVGATVRDCRGVVIDTGTVELTAAGTRGVRVPVGGLVELS